MTNLEALEQRKKELELRRDIARLERNERIANKASDIATGASNLVSDAAATVQTQKSKVATWSWIWVGPLTLIGIYLVLGGLVDGPFGIALAGLVLLYPSFVKLLGRR